MQHKTAIGGIALDVRDEAGVREAFRGLSVNIPHGQPHCRPPPQCRGSRRGHGGARGRDSSSASRTDAVVPALVIGLGGIRRRGARRRRDRPAARGRRARIERALAALGLPAGAAEIAAQIAKAAEGLAAARVQPGPDPSRRRRRRRRHRQGGRHVNAIAQQLGEVGLPAPARRARRQGLGRRRRRWRPQRPHRRRLPGQGRAVRPRARAARAARRRVHARGAVPRLHDQPVRVRRRPARRPRDRRAAAQAARPALRHRRPQHVGPVRGRHELRPVARRRSHPAGPAAARRVARRTSRATGPTSTSSTRSASACARASATRGWASRRRAPRSRSCCAASRR